MDEDPTRKPTPTMKTSRQVQGDIYRSLRASALAKAISGDVYRQGLRPRDSRREDAVVVFTTGTSGQVQDGIVTVNVFVPDIDPLDDGALVEDTRRTEELEALAQEWVEGMRCPGYLFRLAEAVHTQWEPSIGQHFVVVRIRWRYGENEVY